MKPFRFLIHAIALLLVVALGMKHGIAVAASAGILYAGTWLQPEARLGTVTLITSILTGKIADAFRTKVPELSYFSTDFGKDGSQFAQPVKFGQEVISKIAIAPTAQEFIPGNGMGTGATNVKDLVTDTKVAIDQAAIVNIKLPTVDSVKYFLTEAFQQSMIEAGKSLARYVIGKAIAKVTKGNFSQELVSTVAAAEYESLSDARAKLNKQGCGTVGRFCLGETDWMKNLSRDPVIASGDYHDQRTGADPLITLVNIEGFETVREFPNMPTNSAVLGTFTAVAATNVITVNQPHNLLPGQRIRATNSGGALPAGMAINTDYWVRTTPTATTLTISATPLGADLDITDAGTGVHSILRFEAVNAFAGEKRAIHIAFRQLLDNDKMREMLGIPKVMNIIQGVEPETGLSFTWYLWQDGNGTNPTGDIYAACVVAFGVKAGREITGAAIPAGEAAGSGMDYAGLRIVETVSNPLP